MQKGFTVLSMTTETHEYIAKLENWVAEMVNEIFDLLLDCGNWNDSQIIDLFVNMGFTEKDFQMFGYGNFVKEYFADED